MIAISADDDEILITGSIDSLLEICLAIRAQIASSESSIQFSATAHDPAPYARALSEFFIERTSGPALVTATHSRITVSGSDRSLTYFSSWFEFPESAGTGYHQHFDPLPGDLDQSADSIPLIVSVKQAGA